MHPGGALSLAKGTYLVAPKGTIPMGPELW